LSACNPVRLSEGDGARDGTDNLTLLSLGLDDFWIEVHGVSAHRRIRFRGEIDCLESILFLLFVSRAFAKILGTGNGIGRGASGGSLDCVS